MLSSVQMAHSNDICYLQQIAHYCGKQMLFLVDIAHNHVTSSQCLLVICILFYLKSIFEHHCIFCHYFQLSKNRRLNGRTSQQVQPVQQQQCLPSWVQLLSSMISHAEITTEKRGTEGMMSTHLKTPRCEYGLSIDLSVLPKYDQCPLHNIYSHFDHSKNGLIFLKYDAKVANDQL